MLDGESMYVVGKLQKDINITLLHIKKAAREIVSFVNVSFINNR
jgi:hypothetical protein